MFLGKRLLQGIPLVLNYHTRTGILTFWSTVTQPSWLLLSLTFSIYKICKIDKETCVICYLERLLRETDQDTDQNLFSVLGARQKRTNHWLSPQTTHIPLLLRQSQWKCYAITYYYKTTKFIVASGSAVKRSVLYAGWMMDNTLKGWIQRGQ